MIQSKLYELITSGVIEKITIDGEYNKLRIFIKGHYSETLYVNLQKNVEEVVNEDSDDYQKRNKNNEKVRVSKVFKNEYELYNEVVFELNKIKKIKEAKREFKKEKEEVEELQEQLDKRIKRKTDLIKESAKIQLIRLQRDKRFETEIIEDISPDLIG